MPEASRLDAELVRRGLARSRAHAAAAVQEGRVTVDGAVARKPGHRVLVTAAIDVAGRDHYVARSAHKLAGALDSFDVRPADRLALDVGASTGGFTQVLLERGVREVIALDVGHDQLAPELRRDPRVRVVEGVNARELDRDRLAAVAGTRASPTLVAADLSFISLTTVLPALAVTAPEADFVLLVKPQFEVGRGGTRAGVVHDRAARHEAVMRVLQTARDAGLTTAGVVASGVAGTHGNQEYLAWLHRTRGSDPSEWSRALDALG